jgi:2-dehydro-3-deoxyphosphogluconate aldolase / (4S)-4-hydroxy-2-oxoglutarate aldolase
MDLDIPIIGILRGIEANFFSQIMEASFKAGLQAIEVTFNTARAEEIVATNLPRVPEGKYLGMGTVRNLDEAQKAVAAGAMFIVAPNTDIAVIKYAVSQNIPIMPGAFTPTEVYTAWSAGATMIKVFPSGILGPQYIKELRGPFDQISLVAVGGVTRDNVHAYLAAGAKAVGVGTSLFGRQAIDEKNTKAITTNVKEFIEKALNDGNS